MNKRNMILMLSVLTLSAMGQATNEFGAVPQAVSGDTLERQTNQFKPHRNKKEAADPQQKREKIEQRRIQLMERELNRIGVTEEQKAQINELQKAYGKKMSDNAKRVAMARKRLSKLLDEGASMEELEAAVAAVSSAQTEQLWILVKNRLELERILGKEKRDEFMQRARIEYEKHGRRSGSHLPPPPGLPPVPGQGRHRAPPTPTNAPPTMPSPSDS